MFDNRLKYKLKVKDDPIAKRNYKIHRKFLSPLKYVVLITYIGVIPFIQTPYWCILNSDGRPIDNSMIYDCNFDETNSDYNVQFSQIINLNPIVVDPLDLLCIAFFIYFRYYKSTWSVQNRHDRNRNVLFAVLATLSILIFALSMRFKTTAFYGDLLKPFIIINFLGTLRQSLLDFLGDIWGSFTILFTIFAWIFIFSLAGFFMFRDSFEGATYFLNLSASFWSMLTLMTTANFPDVMMPAYYNDFFASIFFVVYLLVGLFFLLNLLLASVFSKFKERFEERMAIHDKVR